MRSVERGQICWSKGQRPTDAVGHETDDKKHPLLIISNKLLPSDQAIAVPLGSGYPGYSPMWEHTLEPCEHAHDTVPKRAIVSGMRTLQVAKLTKEKSLADRATDEDLHRITAIIHAMTNPGLTPTYRGAFEPGTVVETAEAHRRELAMILWYNSGNDTASAMRIRDTTSTEVRYAVTTFATPIIAGKRIITWQLRHLAIADRKAKPVGQVSPSEYRKASEFLMQQLAPRPD